MIIKDDKNKLRVKRALRVRGKISGTVERPRLNVYRSLNHIYAQLIDDVNGHTLVSASSQSKEVAKNIAGKSKTETAYLVGELLGKKAIEKGMTKVVFDRAGYLYTGRVKSLADGARNAGLEF